MHRITGTKMIILDLDGTLVDSKEAYMEAAKRAFTAFGLNVPDAKTVMEIPRRLEQNLPIDDLMNQVRANSFLKVYLDAYYRVAPEKSRPFPSISETLRRLSERAILAIITMRRVPTGQIMIELNRFGVAKYFKHVVTALDTCNPKPSPEALVKCAKQLAVETFDCTVVGDSIVDVRSGKAAGAMTVAVLSGIFSRTELEREKPDLILKSVKELPNSLDLPAEYS